MWEVSKPNGLWEIPGLTENGCGRSNMYPLSTFWRTFLFASDLFVPCYDSWGWKSIERSREIGSRWETPVCPGPLTSLLSKNWGDLLLLERCWDPQKQKTDDFLICREDHSELLFFFFFHQEDEREEFNFIQHQHSRLELVGDDRKICWWKLCKPCFSVLTRSPFFEITANLCFKFRCLPKFCENDKLNHYFLNEDWR